MDRPVTDKSHRGVTDKSHTPPP